MAHKKGQGATRNGRDSNAQFRGVKVFGGQTPGDDMIHACQSRIVSDHEIAI